jgi:hypothetical protein
VQCLGQATADAGAAPGDQNGIACQLHALPLSRFLIPASLPPRGRRTEISEKIHVNVSVP